MTVFFTSEEKVDGAPPRDRVMNTFNSLVRGSLIGINKKLQNVSAVIGNKLKVGSFIFNTSDSRLKVLFWLIFPYGSQYNTKKVKEIS